MSKGVRFAVITKASLKPSDDAGNWGDELAVINEQESTIYIGADVDEKDKVIGPVVPFTISVKGKSYNMEYIRVPVFQEGEILIIDESGREIAGLGRKPSKWAVEYEVFDNLEDAIKKAHQILVAEE